MLKGGGILEQKLRWYTLSQMVLFSVLRGKRFLFVLKKMKFIMAEGL